MEVIEIKQMLSTPKVSQVDEPTLRKTLAGNVLRAFALKGLSVTIEKEILTEQILIIVSELIDNLTRMSDFQSLRLLEIDYAIRAGVRNEFTDVKTYGLNYETIFKWIEAYTFSAKRKQAYISYQQDNQLKQLTQTTELSEAEQRQIIINSINSYYQDYLSEFVSRQKNATMPRNVKMIGQILDVRGVKDSFLVREGLKPKNMPLNEFFEECRKKGLKQII